MNLYFMYGKGLPDPDGPLQGAGNRGRFIRVASAATLNVPAVAALLDAATADAGTPLARGRGYTVVKSISAKQRPRRT